MIVGMDFGTTNSGMAVYDGHQLRLIPLDPVSPNPHVARSALYITNDRTIHIGRDAIETYYRQNLGRAAKYELVPVGEIELTFAELPSFVREVFAERDVLSPGRLFLSFKMGLSSPNYLGTLVGANYFFLEHIIALYLYLTRKRAEAHLQTELDTIVLGRPVRYSDDAAHNELARERLLQAAFRAGYKTVYLQHEPVAAAYYYETFITREQNVLIFDFGGGTLDISLLRLGNPKTRRVLASGGIPIAGDVFDQKIVRALLPPHLGEGETYRVGADDLPIPGSFYDAFSNWQDLLALQRRDRLEALQRIERTARSPRKIHMLRQLIQSNYGIKLFDIAEAGKRTLSSAQQASLLFNGPGFTVQEMLTRADFERLIGSDIRAITRRLDEVVREAGLRDDQIDAVIRTGGSSQIPAFIQLLERRFGASKVRDIDTFSSVTAGLGVIARQVEQGDLSLTAHTHAEHPDPDYLLSKKQGGIPVVDFDLLRRLINLKERGRSNEDQTVVIVGQTHDGSLTAMRHSLEGDHRTIRLTAELCSPVAAVAPDEPLVLMTTDYRFLLRPAGELADLTAAKLDFATIENFHQDAFGKETICALAQGTALQPAAMLAVLTTRGYGKLIAAEPFMNRLMQRIPYRMERSRGYPAAVVPVSNDGELVVFTQAGRAARLPVQQLAALEERWIQVPSAGGVIGALSIEQPGEILIVTASGYGQRIRSSDIPLTTTLNTTGSKITSRALPVAARLHQAARQLWAITNQRILPIERELSRESARLLSLKPGETLVSVFSQ